MLPPKAELGRWQQTWEMGGQSKTMSAFRRGAYCICFSWRFCPNFSLVTYTAMVGKNIIWPQMLSLKSSRDFLNEEDYNQLSPPLPRNNT